MIWLALLGCGSPAEVARCAQPRLWYGPPGATPEVFWGCAPPTRAWEVLPPGFLDPLDTGWRVVGNEVDWDVPWPERTSSEPPEDTFPLGTALTGDTAPPTGDTGLLRPLKRAAKGRDPDDTGEERASTEGSAATGLTGLTGATGATGDTGVTEDELPLGEPTGDTVDTGAAVEPVEAPAQLVDPTDLVVPEGTPTFGDPRDLVVPEEQ